MKRTLCSFNVEGAVADARLYDVSCMLKVQFRYDVSYIHIIWLGTIVQYTARYIRTQYTRLR